MLFIKEIIQAVENCLEIKPLCVRVVILTIFVGFFQLHQRSERNALYSCRYSILLHFAHVFVILILAFLFNTI